ncbi:hypothetical protein [uncultured Methanomethylovorans sp.]|nr:hypothetical protein [uncultured Methanomethylovorans sp.]
MNLIETEIMDTKEFIRTIRKCHIRRTQ